MRLFAAAIAILLAVGSGCSEDESRGTLSIEIAQHLEPTCREQSTTAAFECALVSVCERVPGEATCTPVLATTGGDLGVDGGGPLGFSALAKVSGSKGFEIQLKLHDEADEAPDLDSTHLEITTVLYDSFGQPTHQAMRTGVTPAEFLTTPLTVRAYRYGVSSCAGPNAAGTTPDTNRFVERAFHETTRLPNGDVLIYGGVKEGARPTSLQGVGMLSQPIIELYRVQEGRIDVLDGTFSRTLGRGILLTTDPDAPVYRIFVSGGFDSTASPIGFDQNQNNGDSLYGAPVVVTADALAQPDVILNYDRANGTVTVEDVDMAQTRGAVASDDVLGADVLPVIGGPTATAAGPWTFDRNNAWIERATGREATGAAGRGSLGNADRYGHTVTLVGPSFDNAFVWGGNIATTATADFPALAGQVVGAGGAVTTVPAPTDAAGLPFNPVAFHTATRLSTNDVIVIGGMEVGCVAGTGVGCVNGVTTVRSRRPITRFGVDATGVTTAVEVPACGYQPTIYHSAVRMDDDTLLLTGGAGCTSPPGGACAPGSSFSQTAGIYPVSLSSAENTAGDGLPRELLQGRFAHQVTPLSTCPAGAADCRDPRYLVTGGMVYAGGTTATVEALAHGEVIFAQRTGVYGRLNFDENCQLVEDDGGLDSGVPDTGAPEDACMPDSGGGAPLDSATDAALDAPVDAPVG